MHLPIGSAAKALKAAYAWTKGILGLGFSTYPQYVRHSDSPFSDTFLTELIDFLNAAFGSGYKSYDLPQVKAWLEKFPDLYVCVVDRVLLSATPRTPQIVGTYKLVPLDVSTTEHALSGKFEIIDIRPENMARSLKQAAGIWIGDLRVLSPFQSSQSGVLGRHLMEHIKANLRPHRGRKPIFCRSERKDIQEFLLRSGFLPISNLGDISGKTVWMLPTSVQAANLRRVDRRGRRAAVTPTEHDGVSKPSKVDVEAPLAHAAERSYRPS